ncbi:TIGR02594 family protein [Iodobacter ciconiae]|uniref:TIGR02594 family protein n=1 Tax=Iodobacter ciconiae TaxID=2496266 RepID=A0A3S8ZPC7_9NEIS|nr:TIGR02594 family protein [Iodobacter ciconiae]AZN35325.1 TIGR02594 family protein [Iodobacter ciconiae]
MDNWIKASYNSELRTVDFVDANGSHLIRSGGTLPWRLNNPGNLRPPVVKGVPSPKKTQGYIGIAASPKPNGELGYFFIFPDYNTGRNAIKGNLKRLYSNKSIRSAIQSYAPSNENNTNKYIDDLQKNSGLDPSLIVGELDNAQFEKLVDGIVKIEGYHGKGDTPQKEERRSTTNLVVSNGAQPLADQELILRQDGVDTKVKTDQTGRIPPVMHNPNKGVVEILREKLDGSLEAITQIIASAPGGNLLLTMDWTQYTASTNKHAGAASGKQVTKDAIKYVVQPGDSLSKIASKFKVSVSDLKKENSIKNINKIFPGEVLIIGGGKEAANQPKPNSPTHQESKPASEKAKEKHKKNEPGASVPAKANPLVNAGSKPLATTVSREGVGSPIATISSTQIKAPWMEIAIREAKEWAGYHEKKMPAKDNSKGIITDNYHKEIGSNATLSTAWCAAFVNYCLKESGFAYVKGAAGTSSQFPAMSKHFVKIDKPVYGAIVVYRHTNPKYGTGHVAFMYAKIDRGDFAVLGGNQGDTIKINPHIEVYIKAVKAKVVGFYVPAAYYAHALEVLKNGDDFGDIQHVKDIKKMIGDSADFSTKTQ